MIRRLNEMSQLWKCFIVYSSVHHWMVRNDENVAVDGVKLLNCVLDIRLEVEYRSYPSVS